MRSLVLCVGMVASLGLGAMGSSAWAAGPVGTDVDVHANSMTGTTFTAPETGSYHFTIVSGAYCYVAPAEEGSPFGGWLTQVQIYKKAVSWGAMDQWGTHPLNPDATVGGGRHRVSSAAAAAAGAGMSVGVVLQKGSKVTLLVSDGSNYYDDNRGVVKVRITQDAAGAAPAAVVVPAVAGAGTGPAVVTPAVVAPVVSGKPNVSSDTGR